MISQEEYQQDRARWREKWYREGYFARKPVADVLKEAVARHPETTLTFYRTAQVDTPAECSESTIEALLEESLHIANGFWEQGVRPGEVVAVQMPTWRETALVYLAALNIGAIVLPIVHIYGPKEVEFILRQSGARTLIIPQYWHKVDFVERFRRIGPLPELRRTIVVGDVGSNESDLVTWREVCENRGADFPRFEGDPDGPCVMIYTSGTTSSPKGVLYSHNNLQSEWHSPFFATKGPYLCNFPAGHIAGFNFVMRPFVAGVSMVLFDNWDSELAAELVEKHRIRESGGTGFFLRELLRVKNERNLDFSSLEMFSMGGTGVTPAEIQLAESHGIKAGRSYGSSEHSTVSQAATDNPYEKRAYTDGQVIRGNEVRIVDGHGNDLPLGTAGEIVTQGPELFIGYQDGQLNQENFLPGGWYRTGDIGRLDEEGFLTITDRKKDIIIRGGENIASKEVEDILNEMPEVLESAAASMPDEKYGEKVCAFIRLNPGMDLDLERVRRFFLEAGVARQKTPERLIVISDFPRTPAGKIKKFELRARLRQEFEELHR